MPFSPKDIHRVGEILAFAARTEIMPRFRRLTAAQVREKSSPLDLVTDADERAETVITCRLKAAFPDAIVIGEEGAHKNPALLQAIASAELAFIVDPIDGTRNFTANLPLFGVMAAATVYGEIVAGVIYDPVCQDWAYAVLGAGAWIEQEDGSRITMRVAPSAPVSEWKVSLARIFCRNRSEAPSIAIVRDWQAALGCDVRRTNTVWPRLEIATCYSTTGSCHGIMPQGGSYIRKQAGIARISMARPITRRISVAG
jgi:fructose-1,6-bisphosphatase/inositol monophosphatase family enzyme